MGLEQYVTRGQELPASMGRMLPLENYRSVLLILLISVFLAVNLPLQFWKSRNPIVWGIFLAADQEDGDKVCAMPGAQAMVFRSRIWDINQKCLYLQNDELVAGYLQGPNSALEEKIYWIPNRNFNREKSPVILSIRDGNQCLACSFGTQPVLQLESIRISDLYNDSKEDSIRFTFFRSYKNGMWRFESAAYPGWFLCTSSKSNEPIGLTQDPGSSHVIDFYFQSY